MCNPWSHRDPFGLFFDVFYKLDLQGASGPFLANEAREMAAAITSTCSSYQSCCGCVIWNVELWRLENLELWSSEPCFLI